MIEALIRVLHGANFVEVPHDEISAPIVSTASCASTSRRHSKTTARSAFSAAAITAKRSRFSKWLGWRKRSVEFGVYDDVVLLVAMKAEDTAANGKKRTRKRKVRPGAVLLKYFRDIASADLNALFPGRAGGDGPARPAHARRAGADRRHPDPAQARLDADRAVPGGRILSRLRPASVRDDDMAGALAAVGGLVALGGFIVTPVGAIPAPVAAPSEDAVRQRLLPQRQQQRRHLRLHHRRGRGAGMQGGVSRLLFPAGAGRRADRGRARPAHRSLAQERSAPTSISSATTRWRSSTGSACCDATATGSRCCRSTRHWCGSTASGTIFSRSTIRAKAEPIRRRPAPAKRYPASSFAAAPRSKQTFIYRAECATVTGRTGRKTRAYGRRGNGGGLQCRTSADAHSWPARRRPCWPAITPGVRGRSIPTGRSR